MIGGQGIEKVELSEFKIPFASASYPNFGPTDLLSMVDLLWLIVFLFEDQVLLVLERILSFIPLTDPSVLVANVRTVS